MRRYETIIIINPNSGEDIITEVIDKTTEIIENVDGSIVKIDKWGLKKLAYPIQKEEQGFYVLIEYAGMPAAVDEMERIFRIDERILKYMTVKLQDVFIADEPSAEAEEPEAETPPIEGEKAVEKEEKAETETPPAKEEKAEAESDDESPAETDE